MRPRTSPSRSLVQEHRQLDRHRGSVGERLETVDAAWGLALAAVAVVGGLTGTVGNRITVPFGLVGGLAFAVASATIPYTDTFDALFKTGSLLSIWAILVGVTEVRRRTAS